jgi:CMP-2-keto-3-deoxyoctulosonic acid synthetase
MKSLILIPSRMASKRFPNKPMALIDGKPMIQRVWEQAISSKLGDVIVACSEKEVRDCILSLGGKAVLTDPDIPSGTDRIFAAIKNKNDIDNFDSIINLQGDMPLINPNDISKVNDPILQGFDIGTIATSLSKNQNVDQNVTKVKINWIKRNSIGQANDFFKSSINQKLDIYHHVGIYSFRYES